MKKIRLIALLILMMVMVSFQGLSQENSCVLIRISPSSTDKSPSQMLTIDEEGNITTTELKNEGFVNTYHDNIAYNTILIQKELNKWLSKGYKIVSSVSEMDRKIMIILTKE